MNKPVVCEKVFVVEPRGNGLDDTENLQKAFNDALAEPPGTSVVQLVEGNYSIGFIEVHEFYGSFIGAGKGKTIITARKYLNCNPPNKNKLYYYLIKFVGGDIYMSDMTIQTLPGGLCWSNSSGSLHGLVIFSDFSNIYTSMNGYVRAFVNNVECMGHTFGKWYNAQNGVSAMSDTRLTGITRSHIDITVTNSVFDTLAYGVQVLDVKDGKLIVGTRSNGNVFNKCYQPVSFYDVINVEISAVGNILNIPKGMFFGLDVDNSSWGRSIYEPQTKKILCNIEGNEFNLIGGDCGLWLHDHRRIKYPDENLPIVFEVKSNTINMQDAYIGISMPDLYGAVIRNNKFTGNGTVGTSTAVCAWKGIYTENSLYLGNNFSNTSFTGPAIFLGVRSKNCTVIGIGQNAFVNNKGINNVITGVNVKDFDDALGQTIVDNLHLMKEEMRLRVEE